MATSEEQQPTAAAAATASTSSVAGSSSSQTAETTDTAALASFANALIKLESKEEEQDKDAASASADTSRDNDSLDGTGRRRAKPRDRGLDGGYWSQVNTLDESAAGRKRQRISTERLVCSTEFYTHEKTTRRSNSLESVSSSNTKGGGGGGGHHKSSYNRTSNRHSDRCVLFNSKSFITVLNEQNSFYLCQTVQCVYEDSKKSKIQWLEEIEPNKYKYGSVDWVEPYSIIARVKCRRVPGSANLIEIVEEDLKRVQELADRAVKEGGITVDFDEVAGSSDDDSDAESIVDLDSKDLYDKEESDELTDSRSHQHKRRHQPAKSGKRINQSWCEDDYDTSEHSDQHQVQPSAAKKPKLSRKSLPSSSSAKASTKYSTSEQTTTKRTATSKQQPSNPGTSKKSTRFVDSDESTSSSSDQDGQRAKKKLKQSKSTTSGNKENTLHAAERKNSRDKHMVPCNRPIEENTKIEIYAKDPFFEGDADDDKSPPFISPGVQAKMAFKAIYLRDLNMLKRLLDDEKRVPTLHVGKCAYNNMTPAQYAIHMEFKPALELLIDDVLHPVKSKRVEMQRAKLNKLKHCNASTSGDQDASAAANGDAKEGNEAFTKDLDNYDLPQDKSNFFTKLIEFACESGAPVDIFELIVTKFKESNGKRNFNEYDESEIVNNLSKIVLFGHRKLVAYVLKKSPESIGCSELHLRVLGVPAAGTGGELAKSSAAQLTESLCNRKAFSADQATPVHFACINPDAKRLRALLSVSRDLSVADKKGRKPVHYAAVCEGPGPLEYLINRCSPYDLDAMGNMALHYACLAGRSHNVELLLSKALQRLDNESVQTTEIQMDNKFGLGGINKPTKRGTLPIHLAISRNNYECVKVLIKYRCNYEYPLPTSMGNITPLMYACQLGHFKIVQLLHAHRARIEARDRYKKTAAMHATMCGNARILSFLLRKGTNPNAVDSSGNSVLHYACAYGWYHCMKLLIEAGASVHVLNDSKLTPSDVASLKGHTGLCEYLGKLKVSTC